MLNKYKKLENPYNYPENYPKYYESKWNESIIIHLKFINL